MAILTPKRTIDGVMEELIRAKSTITQLKGDIRWKEQEIEKMTKLANELRAELNELVIALQKEIEIL